MYTPEELAPEDRQFLEDRNLRHEIGVREVAELRKRSADNPHLYLDIQLAFHVDPYMGTGSVIWIPKGGLFKFQEDILAGFDRLDGGEWAGHENLHEGVEPRIYRSIEHTIRQLLTRESH